MEEGGREVGGRCREVEKDWRKVGEEVGERCREVEKDGGTLKEVEESRRR